MSTKPVNVADLGEVFVVDEVRVIEWHPVKDGKGLPTQVHVLLGIPSAELHIALRLKSRRAALEVIAALQKHTDAVWPVS